MSNYNTGDITVYKGGYSSVDVGLVTENRRAYWLHGKTNLTFSGDTAFYTKIACKVLGTWDDE